MPRIKALSPQGGAPLHKMQPTTGAIPPVEFHLHSEGMVELAMFCRSGPTKGRWHCRVVELDQALGFLNNLQATQAQYGPAQVLKELEQFFGWTWDSSAPAEQKAKSLTLDDLGL